MGISTRFNMELVVTSAKACKNVSMANISNIRSISFVSKYKLKFSICPKFLTFVLLMYGSNEPCWLRCIHMLLKHLNMDHMLTHPENFKSSHIYSIKKKLRNNYEHIYPWKYLVFLRDSGCTNY
jgi:hypothetical protein